MSDAPTEADARVALEKLIRDEGPRLRRFFRTKVPDADAYDLVQSTMLAFVEHGKTGESSRAYLWGIARNKVLQYYGKHKPSTTFDSTVHGVLDVGRTLSSRLDDRDRLLEALRGLPADHQMAFELRHGEELSLEEVASALDVSLATAKRYISAATDRLRLTLGVELEEVARAYSEQ
jgi:RNA polymerase sigma factor (sigma-70 family)